MSIERSAPNRVRTLGSTLAVATAPTPSAADSNPKPPAVRFRRSRATTGSSADNELEKSTNSPRRASNRSRSGECRMYRNPVRIADARCSAGSVVWGASPFQHATTITTPRNDTALITNTAPGPDAAMITPAIAGPIDCAMFISIEFSATAGVSSSRPTSSGVSDVQAGMLSVPPTDNRKVSTNSHVVVTRSVRVSTPSAAATASIIDWVISSMSRRSITSASAPANNARRNPGAA